MIINIEDDFDLKKIAHSGQCFRVRELDKDTFRFVTKEKYVTITNLDCNSNDGSVNMPSLRDSKQNHRLEISCSEAEWNNVWRDYFDLDTNYSSIRDMIPADDKYLQNAASLGCGIRILRQDPFEMLISFIISQRKSIPAIKKSVETLCKLYGSKSETYHDEELYFFPTPSSMKNATRQELQGCGLGYRLPYITQAVDRVICGEIDLISLNSLSDEDLIDTLKSFYGVGDKVANCVALFAYHRLGLAPIDTWINKVIDTNYNGKNPFLQYGEYAGVMQQYMFYAAQYMKI